MKTFQAYSHRNGGYYRVTIKGRTAKPYSIQHGYDLNPISLSSEDLAVIKQELLGTTLKLELRGEVESAPAVDRWEKDYDGIRW